MGRGCGGLRGRQKEEETLAKCLAKRVGGRVGGKKQPKQDKWRRMLHFGKHEGGKSNTLRLAWSILLLLWVARGEKGNVAREKADICCLSLVEPNKNATNVEQAGEFYTEIDRLLTKDLSWKTGHNIG